MLDEEILHRRLRSLDVTLSILSKLGRYSFDEFIEEPERYGSAERFLQLAVEALMDMGAHLVATRGLGTITRYRDIPTLLKDHGYVNAEQCERWIKIIGFRNILVHDYLEVDRRIVHSVLQENLSDIQELRNVFFRLL
ncbi:MAG: DUF86 domain-containing protein [Trueperaceae bacterium]